MYCNDLYKAIDDYNNCEGSQVYFFDLIQSLNHNNIIQVPGGINPTDNPIIYRQCIEYILSNNSQHTDKPLVVFNWVGEAYVVEYIELMHLLIQELIEKHNYTIEQFVYLTGAAYSLDNIKKYRRLHSMYRYLPRKVGYVNHWEFYQAEDMRRSLLDQIQHIASETKKKFLCFNKQPRPHRVALLALLENNNLLDDAYISANSFNNKDTIDYSISAIFPKLFKDIEHGYNKIKDRFPINLTLQQDNLTNLTQVDVEVYRNSLFSLVTETIYAGRIDQIHSSTHIKKSVTCYPCTFITEKTFKPIRAEHPFIIVATPYFLEHLRAMGYKTFSPFIDETYDTIENPEQRLLAILREVERLSNMSGADLLNWQEGIREITTYNYNKLCNASIVVHYEDTL